MKFAIDIDGVITANPQALSWITYHLSKNENGHEIHIISWRDGSDPKRVQETIDDLKNFGIRYTSLTLAPKRLTNLRQSALWKIATIQGLGINVWIDDEIKSYKRDLGIDVDRLLPDVVKIQI